MKVAIFSDVQGNLPAMEEAMERMLAWHPDLTIMDGDLVNRGPSSRACLQRFEIMRRKHGWLPIKGNHERWMLHCARQVPADALELAMRRFADWTCRELGSHLPVLDSWPEHLCFHDRDGAPGSAGAGWVHVSHGTMARIDQGITSETTDDEVRDALPDDVALFVTAHTHRPLARVLAGVSVLNVGSVGSPFDGDPRGSFALLESRAGRWHWEIVRFEYDRTRAERDFHSSGFLAAGGPLARILFEEWRRARPLISRWHRDYKPAVLAGTRTLEQSVTAYLATLD